MDVDVEGEGSQAAPAMILDSTGHQRVGPSDPRVLAAAEAGNDPEGLSPAVACRLCAVQPKVGKNSYCVLCRRRVDACRLQQSRLSAEHLAHFKALERLPDPTQFRCTVWDFEDQTGQGGQAGGKSGARRAEYDALQYRDCWPGVGPQTLLAGSL